MIQLTDGIKQGALIVLR